jgi:putative ABC transport system permease protein
MSVLGSMCRSLWRFHRLLAGILVLEYALAFAITLSAAEVLLSRAEAINETSGVEEAGLYVLQGTGVDQRVRRFDLMDAQKRFQAIAGADQVALGSGVPFFGYLGREMPIIAADDPRHSTQLQASGYEGGQYFTAVLGVRFLRGRAFQNDEIVHRYGDTTRVTILSASLARRLFHGERAVGKQVKIGAQMHTVVGVIEPLAAPRYLGNQRTTYTFILPNVSSGENLLLIRYSGPKADLLGTYEALRKYDMGKVNWSLVPYSTIRNFYFRGDRTTVAALAAVVCVVLITALCGILGLTSYWIARRRPQIAMRRALGAQKRDVLLHFLFESGMLVALGLALGLTLNFFISAGFGVAHSQDVVAWLLAIILVLLMAVVVIYCSLRRWLYMEPAELMRSV